MAEQAVASPAPIRRRRRHCVVVRPTSRRRRRHLPTTMAPPDGDAAATGDEYLVEKILGERYDPRTGRRVFRVRWQGYTPEHDTWEPEANLAGVREFVDAYRRERAARMQERYLKRKGKRSDDSNRRRMGSWEYVPTSELIAKKTRFFDDLAEGRIDVRSDDLYSRVKCRRRQTGSDEEAEGPEAGEKENLEGAGPSRLKRSPRGRRFGVARRGRRRTIRVEPEEQPEQKMKVEVPVEEEEKKAVPEAQKEEEEEEKKKNEMEEEEEKKEEEEAKKEEEKKEEECGEVPAAEEEEEKKDGANPHLQREASSDISPPQLSPMTPMSPKSPVALSPAAPKLSAPTSAPSSPAAGLEAVRSRGPKAGRKPRPPHTAQRRRLVQKVSPNLQPVQPVPFAAPPPQACSDPGPPAPCPFPEPVPSFAPGPARVPSPAAPYLPPASTAGLSCLGAPSIRPEILEKMIDDCMSQNHIPDVNPLLSYVVDDAKTPPPALVSAATHDWVDSEREQLESYLQVSAGGCEALVSVPHLRPLPLSGGRASNVQLRVAVLQNNYSLVRAFLASSAGHPGFAAVYDLEQRDGDGESLLARCVRQGQRHMAELLLQFGALTESPRRSDGATPLMLAVDAGQYHMTRLLLDYGASPDHQNRLGETCLHRAVRRGHSALVDLLWRRGVDFSRIDAHMQTALKCARSYPLAPSQPQMERLLVGFLQTHNHHLNLAWTAFLSRNNLEAESLLYPPGSFVSAAHCPHNLLRFQMQVPPGAEHHHLSGCAALPGAHVLLIVHALPDHPSLFWLEDGPCVVESVSLNGTEQRRFGQQWFLSSLYPLLTGATNDVEIKLSGEQTSSAQFRSIRLVVIAMKVRARPLPGPNLVTNPHMVPAQAQRSPVAGNSMLVTRAAMT